MLPSNLPTGYAVKQWTAHRRVFTNAATVGALTTCVKIAGAVKVAVTARYFGASDDLDAFLIAFLLPAFFGDIVGGAFSLSFVPALIHARSNEGESAARRLAREGQAIVLGLMLLVTAALAVGNRWLLPLFGSGFTSDKLEMTSSLLLILLPWLPMAACMAAWRAVLNANGAFAVAAAAPLSLPLVTILFLFAGAGRFGVRILSIATVIAVTIEFAVLAGGIRSIGYPLFPSWHGWKTRLTEIGREYLPLMAATLITSSYAMVDQAVAGSLASGSVSALAYGTRLVAVIFAVGAAAIATALLPEFSRLVAEGAWDRLRSALRANVTVALLVMIPTVAALVWLSEFLVRIVFERGAFDAADTELVSRVQTFALLQAPFALLFAISSRLATALSANGLILRAGILGLAVTVTGDLLFSRQFGVAGITIAGVLSQMVAFSTLAWLLWRREPRIFRAL